MHMLYGLAAIVGLCSAAANVEPLTIYVDPVLGDDDAPAAGLSQDKPLRTLAETQRRLRAALREQSARTLVVELLPGSHRVPPGGLVLTAEDTTSAANSSVVWRGAAGGGTSLTGGEVITDWTSVNDPSLPKGIVAARAPKLPSGTIRHLYVDGKRAARTRVNASLILPGGKPDKYGAPLANLAIQSSSIDGQEHANSYTTPVDLNWSNPVDVEFVYPVGMSESRCAANHIERNMTRNKTSIVMKQPCMWNLVNRPWGSVTTPPIWIENLREELKVPGQFYFDRAANQILYFPLPGQDMSRVNAVIAIEEVLVKHDGVKNHQWHNVTFEYATWLRPQQSGGFVEQQTGACNICPVGTPIPNEGCGMNDDYIATPGNVQVSGSTDLEFVSCHFKHLGAYGASAANSSQRIAWRRCTFTDISAGAVMLGDFKSWNCNGGASVFKGRGSSRPNKTCTAADASTLDSHFTVEDCVVANIPVEYKATTAITTGYVASTYIQHNLIANATYSGLSLGWGWGREAAGTGDNHVIGNRVEGVLSDYCCDGGGIYTLGPQPNSTIEKNYILQPFRDDWPHPRQKCVNSSEHDMGNAATPGNYSGCSGKGIYHDNGSGGWNDTRNILCATAKNKLLLSASASFGTLNQSRVQPFWFCYGSDGSWNRFMDVDAPWSGPIEYGPGNNSNTGKWNLCPGADGKTHHDCRINMTHNWIRMVNPSGNGNGGYSACAPPSWWDDGIDNRPSWYPRNISYPCWTLDTTNWMNGQPYMGLPNDTPGWPGWIHGVTWGPKIPDDPYATGKRGVDVDLPAAASAIIAEAGPRGQ